ncbi:MAG: PorP/SprF family type IX secretion system membrane protein [Bacteroidia bacterium]
MKKKSLLLLVAIFFMPSFLAWFGGLSSFRGKAAGIFAQQLPFSSQYYTNSFVINPAFTGNSDYINAFLTHRSQWTGLAGAPQTSYLTVDGPMRSRNSGLGLKVYTDVTDIISRVGAFGSYSYKLKLNDSSHVLFGLAMGALGNKLDFSKAVIKDNNDPFLYQQSKSRTVFSADIGVAYVWKRLTVGFAIPQVLGNRVKYTILNDDNSYYNFKRHYHGTIKYEFDLVKEKGITAYPLLMVRAVKGGPFQYDLNGVVDWKNKGWVGLTFHSNYAFAISAGARYKNFSIGYAYDIGVNKVRSYLGTTSEFLLGYTFADRKKYRGPEGSDESDTDTLTISKTSRDTIYSIVAAQLKALADSNKAEVERLKAELAKAKAGDPATSADGKPLAYISGRLVDEQGNPVNDAQVEVVNKSNNQVVARPFTNADGTVRIPVPAGQTYDVVFNKPGYLYKPVNVSVPETAGYEWSLKDVTMQKLEVGKKVVLNNIQFDLNKASLKPESYAELDQTVKLIKEIPSLEMEVSGHTDNVGSASGNQELSQQRAKAVMDYLVSKGCDQNRLSYKGYGASQPIADNNSESGRKLNRRTEFKVLKVEGQYDIVSGSEAASVGANRSTSASVSNAANDAAIAQLKAKTENYEQQLEQLRQELAKVKSAPATTTANTENPVIMAQLKAMSDSNQVQLERMKAELAKAKAVSTPLVDESRMAQLQAKADSNQAQIDLLKAELAASKSVTGSVDNARMIELKTKSDSNQVVMNQIKAELAQLKTAAPAEDPRMAQLKAKADSNQAQIDLLRAELALSKASAATPVEDPRMAQLKAKSDTNQVEIERLKAELAKSKAAAPVEDPRMAQLKAKADSNQAQIDLLRAELAISRAAAATPVEDPRMAQLKAKSDTNQVEIERLKAELAKSKTTAAPVEDPRMAQLKAKSDTNQVEIERIKAELAKSKTTTAAPVEDPRIAQLKVKSDSNQVEIERLKAELAKSKTTAAPVEDPRMAQLKTKSDSNQVEIERIKAELAKSKTTAAAPAEDPRMAQLKEKADTNQRQIEQLKWELTKVKLATMSNNTGADNTAAMTQLKAKADSNQVQIDKLKAELAKAKDAKVPVSNVNEAEIAQLKAKSDSNKVEIERLKALLAKVNTTDTKTATGADSEVAIALLKAKTDTYQSEIDKLKADLEKVKAAEPKTTPATNQENDAVLVDLKIKSDASQAEINNLKAELEKMKAAKATTGAPANDAALADLKTKSDAYQTEINTLKAELEKMKAAKATTGAPANDAALADLKTKSDAYQAEIDKLKTELEKVKSAEPKTASNPANDAAIAQLKSKSDGYQSEIEQLKAEIAKLKGNAASGSSSSAEAERQLALLKAKAEADQAEINRLKAEQEKAKNNTGTATTAPGNTGTATPNNTTTTTPGNTTTTTTSTPGVRTYKTTDFLDDKGKPVTTGFYVIIGTFGSKENADRFRATSVMKGHGTTKIIQNQNSKVYNITIVKTNNKEDADAERAKYKSEYPDLWILKLE